LRLRLFCYLEIKTEQRQRVGFVTYLDSRSIRQTHDDTYNKQSIGRHAAQREVGVDPIFETTS